MPRLGWWACVALCLASHTVSAQDDDARVGQARALFQEGRDLADEERWDEAVERFRAALALRDAPNIRYNLAVSLARAGRVLEAGEELRRVERDPGTPDHVRTAAREMIADLDSRIAHVRVRLVGELDGVEVTIDGRPVDLGVLAVPVPLDAGPHRIVATRRGREIAEQEVAVGVAESSTVTLQLGEADPVALGSDLVAREPAQEASGGAGPEAAIGLGAAAAVLLATAVALSVGGAAARGESDAATARADTSGAPGDVAEANALADRVEGLNIAADIAWGAALATGIAVLFVSLTTGSGEPPPAAPTVLLGPSPAGLVTGLQCAF